MKKLIHLSDLHFGTEVANSPMILLQDIYQLAPDIIVVSGDLTQRATTRQFQLAQNFLKELANYPILCVPGNHDIALYRFIERFFYPYFKYNRWIKSEFGMEYVDEQLAILGINSVTPFKPMGGYITQKQLTDVQTYFQSHSQKTKIVVMHHNLISSERHKIINDAEKILQIFAQNNIHCVLSGHIHHAYVELLKRNFAQNNLYIITAGTPVSSRTLEPNSYNLLEFTKNQFKWSLRTLVNHHFENTIEQWFDLTPQKSKIY